jgi:hypothetical protein
MVAWPLHSGTRRVARNEVARTNRTNSSLRAKGEGGLGSHNIGDVLTPDPGDQWLSLGNEEKNGNTRQIFDVGPKSSPGTLHVYREFIVSKPVEGFSSAGSVFTYFLNFLASFLYV